MEHLIQIQYCYEGLFSVISIGLLLYSHIPTALVALIFGTYLLFKERNLASNSFFAVCALFALWCMLDLTIWFSFFGASVTMLSWSLIDLVSLFFFFYAYRFLYTFTRKAELPQWQLLVSFVLIAPKIILTFLGMNLLGFNTTLCEAEENLIISFYTYFVQGVFLLSVVASAVVQWRADGKKRMRDLLASVGVFVFLLFFFSATFVASFLTNYTASTTPYNYEIYGLFGMPVLLVLLGYLIVRYQAFNIKLIAAQAIIAALVIFDASKIFFSSSRAEFVVNLVTMLFVVLFGSFLIRSVKQEIRGREHNELLAKDLALANTRLRELDRQKSEFVSIASHQLRSPLTAIRGYTSMLMEGGYGKLPRKVADVVDRIRESSTYMASSIEDFLNVSRIEQGRMKYECALINVKEMAEKVVDELRTVALKKGLVLLFRSNCEGKSIANVDPGKMRQILYNIIDNSVKYTQQGSVTVFVGDASSPGKITIAVTDTGVGMSEETIANLFDKFVRAKNANLVNVSGTGLGLFVARQMIKEMSGTITATSPGEGLGSTFSIEIPCVE